jgi:protein SCO1/2
MDDQYSHGSGLLILTPDGRISRFLPGLMYPVLDTRLALVEAAEGKIGTLSDKLALLCYSYDPETGKYGLLVNRIILVACLVTIAAVAWMIIALLKIDRRRTREALAETTS